MSWMAAASPRLSCSTRPRHSGWPDASFRHGHPGPQTGQCGDRRSNGSSGGQCPSRDCLAAPACGATARRPLPGPAPPGRARAACGATPPRLPGRRGKVEALRHPHIARPWTCARPLFGQGKGRPSRGGPSSARSADPAPGSHGRVSWQGGLGDRRGRAGAGGRRGGPTRPGRGLGHPEPVGFGQGVSCLDSKIGSAGGPGPRQMP